MKEFPEPKEKIKKEESIMKPPFLIIKQKDEIDQNKNEALGDQNSITKERSHLLTSDDLNICVEALLKKSKSDGPDGTGQGECREFRRRFRKNKDQ
jgi:hypothetical protein